MVLPRGSSKKRKAMLMGVGLDNKDGHTRVTKGDNFVMMGGSEETHERMTETAIKVNEKLSARGKALEEVSPKELIDIIHDVHK
ncbi:MAG: hypothetical protein WCV67_09615 [Victivallaceae bacterium]|jgi:hypothetical protein